MEARMGRPLEMPGMTVPEVACVPALGPDDLDRTTFQPDELTALCSFLAASVEETSPRQLIERALACLHSQTQATITGFHSLDPDNPLPKIGLPEKAALDIHLSRQLTQKAQQTGRLVWLNDTSEDSSRSDSLLVYRDALCV